MSATNLLENRIVLGAGEDAVARAVLLILNTIGTPPEGIAVQGWRIAPGGNVLPDSAVVQHLSRMPKPLVCERIPAGAQREIRCGYPDENPRWKWWAQAQQDVGSFLGVREREEMERTGNTQVLLVGESESIVLSVSEVEQLERDYVILGTHTITRFIASRLDPLLDVAMVWRYWRSTSSTRVEQLSE